MTDEFSPDERALLAPYFTNLDRPVFALVNLPEVVKGPLTVTSIALSLNSVVTQFFPLMMALNVEGEPPETGSLFTS